VDDANTTLTPLEALYQSADRDSSQDTSTSSSAQPTATSSKKSLRTLRKQTQQKTPNDEEGDMTAYTVHANHIQYIYHRYWYSFACF
jgi:Tfp pilus tip-associated adhesin PilY1